MVEETPGFKTTVTFWVFEGRKTPEELTGPNNSSYCSNSLAKLDSCGPGVVWNEALDKFVDPALIIFRTQHGERVGNKFQF